MASLDTNLNNFSYWEILDTIFGRYSTDFVYTAAGIFRRTKPPVCPECGMQMNYNGYNTYEKRGLGSVKIGRYVCPSCNKKCEEERSFWEKLKDHHSLSDEVSGPEQAHICCLFRERCARYEQWGRELLLNKLENA